MLSQPPESPVRTCDAWQLDGETAMSRPSDDNAPFSALAFKIMSDPFVGSLTFTRIYSGVLESGTSVYNSVKVG